MQTWGRFGEQVNRLVYTLAGAKFMGNIERANRFVAEHIHYSEASVRMMRQGRFRPQDDASLQAMVQLGKREAELGYWWARGLLKSGCHPNTEAVLRETYDGALEHLAVTVTETVVPAAFFLLARVVAAFLGTLVTLALWAYGLQRGYPPPHEPGLALELLWGVSVGAGLALGLWAFERYPVPDAQVRADAGPGRYLSLPLGGGVGATLWSLIGARLSPSHGAGGVQSGAGETLAFGTCYVLSIVALIVADLLAREQRTLTRPQWIAVAGMVTLGGLSALAGYLAAYHHPAFANQRDIDLFVGLSLRMGLAVVAGLGAPPGRYPTFPAAHALKWLPWYG